MFVDSRINCGLYRNKTMFRLLSPPLDQEATGVIVFRARDPRKLEVEGLVYQGFREALVLIGNLRRLTFEFYRASPLLKALRERPKCYS